MSARPPASLRRLLLVEFLLVAAVLTGLLYLAVRYVAGEVADRMQDNLLAASALTIAERLALGQGEVDLDLPYSALEMLGVSGQERVFYRVRRADGGEVTGYADLPLPEGGATGDGIRFANARYRGDRVRVAAVRRTLASRREPVGVDVAVAQTRESLDALSRYIALAALAIGLGFMAVAAVLGWFAVERALAPLRRLAGAIERRAPHRLEPFEPAAPREVRPLLDALNRFVARLRSNLDVTERFIADAAHRLRTPLAGVRVQAELAAGEARPLGRGEAFDRLVRSVDEVSQLTNQLLANATVRYRGDRGERERVDLFDLCHGVVADLGPAAAKRGTTIDLVEEPDADLTVHGDAVSILEAVRNLVDNAVKYGRDGGRVTVSLAGAGAEVRIAVADDGPGIPPADRERVLRRFERGSHREGVIGSGLGLAISAEAARAHGGSLRIDDAPDGGARVVLAFPAGERT